MSAIACLNGKVEAGLVDRRAAEDLKRWIAEKEEDLRVAYGKAEAARMAAMEVADAASQQAARMADLAVMQLAKQQELLSGLAEYRSTLAALRADGRAPAWLKSETKGVVWPYLRSLLTRDPAEIATGANVHYLARDLRGRAHARLGEAIDRLRPKMLGLKPETVRELDLLAAAYGRADATPEGRTAMQAFSEVNEWLRGLFNAAGGAIAERKNWRIPNPVLDRIKVASTPLRDFIADMRQWLDREDMLDFATGKPLSDADLDRVLTLIHENGRTGWTEGAPSAQGQGRTMLANSRSDPRIISLKDDDAWVAFARKYGEHDSPYRALLDHVESMSSDIAMMRVFGPNPEAMKSYLLDLFPREVGQLTKSAPDGATPKEVAKLISRNERSASSVAVGESRFRALWAETTGEASLPVNTQAAAAMGNLRTFLSGVQMGSAIISSITDPGMVALAARFNGLPATRVLSRAVKDLADGTSEIKAAQMGLVADSIAYAARENDRYMSEAIRSGVMARMSSAVIRASGLRRTTAVLRNAFGLEMMAVMANRAGTPMDRLDPSFRAGLQRYGISAEDWDLIRASTPHQPRDDAPFLRPEDVRAGGSAAHEAAAEKLMRFINTEMDYAVIDSDPATRALINGENRPGTVTGEARRSAGMYKSFAVTLTTTLMARSMARGWDGSRLGHAGISFVLLTVMGALAMQAKQIANGKDPVSMDPSTPRGARNWGAAVLQGGGLGIFGDLLGQDQTRFGNTFAATVAGPVAAFGESVLGDFVIKNLQLAGKGEKTHFFGDAAYLAAKYTPGSTLWFSRLALQRTVFDQLALMLDDRAPARFARVEQEAQKAWGQKFWWRPGQVEPARAPDFGGSP